MTALILAFVAGLVTLLNPCVLPILPIIIGSALQENNKAPLALALGLSISFTVFGIFILAFGFSLGIDQDNVRSFAATLLVGLGLILLVPKLQRGFASLMAPIANKGGQMMSRVSGKGLMGQFLVGLLLGLVWSPCVGPTLGVAIAAASQGESIFYSGLTFFVFSLGLSASLLIFAYGSRRALGTRKRSFQKIALWAKPALGFLLVLVGAMILTGYDRVFEAALVDIMPEWLVSFTTSF